MLLHFTAPHLDTLYNVHSVKCNTDWGKHVIEHTAVCPQLQSTLTFQSNTNRVSDDMRTMNETFLHSCHFTLTDVGIVLGKMRRVIKQTVTNSKLSGVREIQRNAQEYMTHFKLFYSTVPLLQDFHIMSYYIIVYYISNTLIQSIQLFYTGHV